MSVSQERRTHKGARQEKERKEGQKKGECARKRLLVTLEWVCCSALARKGG